MTPESAPQGHLAHRRQVVRVIAVVEEACTAPLARWMTWRLLQAERVRKYNPTPVFAKEGFPRKTGDVRVRKPKG